MSIAFGRFFWLTDRKKCDILQKTCMEEDDYLKKIVVKFTYDADIIQVPGEIARNIRKYQREFDKWLYDKENDHGYWVMANGQRRGVAFDTQAFVDYLNAYPLQESDEKAVLAEQRIAQIPEGLPILYF